MKLLIQIVLVALIIGGLSAGGSFYWQQKMAKSAVIAPKPDDEHDPDSDEGVETSEEAEHAKEASVVADVEPVVEEPAPEPPKPKPIAIPESFGPPAAIRPPYDPNADEAGELISRLRARAVSTSKQERRVMEREEAMKMIIEDLRMVQSDAARLRKRMLEEADMSLTAAENLRKLVEAERADNLRATEEERTRIQEELEEERKVADDQIEALRREKEAAVVAAEEALKAAREEQEVLKQQLDAIRNPPPAIDRSGSPEETANLKKLSSVMNSMPADSTSKVLVELVEKGRTEAVVALLNAMKPRQSAEVISTISELKPQLAADLVERLKRLKKESANPPAPAN